MCDGIFCNMVVFSMPVPLLSFHALTIFAGLRPLATRNRFFSVVLSVPASHVEMSSSALCSNTLSLLASFRPVEDGQNHGLKIYVQVFRLHWRCSNSAHPCSSGDEFKSRTKHRLPWPVFRHVAESSRANSDKSMSLPHISLRYWYPNIFRYNLHHLKGLVAHKMVTIKTTLVVYNKIVTWHFKITV